MEQYKPLWEYISLEQYKSPPAPAREVALTSPYLQLKRPVVVIVLEKPWGTHYRLKAYPIDGRDQNKFTTDMTVGGKAALANLGVKPAIVPATAVS